MRPWPTPKTVQRSISFSLSFYSFFDCSFARVAVDYFMLRRLRYAPVSVAQKETEWSKESGFHTPFGYFSIVPAFIIAESAGCMNKAEHDITLSFLPFGWQHFHKLPTISHTFYRKLQTIGVVLVSSIIITVSRVCHHSNHTRNVVFSHQIIQHND